MLFKRLNRTDAERVFVVMQANAAGIAADDVVSLEFAAASVDGVKVIQPTTGNMLGTVGVADAAIANGAYGLVQVYGYRSTSRIGRTNTTYETGVALTPVNGQDYLSSITSVANGAYLPAFVLLESAATSVSSDTISKKIFIRCM